MWFQAGQRIRKVNINALICQELMEMKGRKSNLPITPFNYASLSSFSCLILSVDTSAPPLPQQSEPPANTEVPNSDKQSTAKMLDNFFMIILIVFCFEKWNYLTIIFLIVNEIS